eukprot:gene29226-biopygen8522
MAFKNHMPVGDFRTPHNYTAAMQKWWLQDRGEPVQLRTGVLPARQLDETRLSIRACESTLTPGFESFSPGRRGTRQREKQAPDSSSASKRRKRQEDAKREEAKRGGNNREAGNGHPVQDEGDATQDAANEAMPKDLRAIPPRDFKAELMTRYSTESPSLDKPGQHHFSSVNNQLFKGTMDAAVSKSGTKASGVMFATEEVGQTAVEGLSKPMTAQAWFSRLQLDYATTRRDALDLRGTSELLMPKLTITEFKKANGFITF